MKKWKAIASILIVFLLGALAGALVTHKVCQQRVESIMRGEPRSIGEFIVRRLNHELRLDDDQLEKLRAILRETHAEMKNVRRQFKPRIEEILAGSQNKVRAILRPDQLEEYEKIITDQKKRRESEENGR